jgi:hypothetical protein
MRHTAEKRNHTLSSLIRVTCTTCRFEWLDRTPDHESETCLKCGNDTLLTRPFDVSATPTHGRPKLEVIT